jgi:hypothetical protein
MDRTSIARRIGRGLMVLALAASVGSLTSPGDGNGATIALGILGGALAGAAIASSRPPGYYAAPPAYYYPDAPPVYYVASAPVYSYSPTPAVHHAPAPYCTPGFYYSND